MPKVPTQLAPTQVTQPSRGRLRVQSTPDDFGAAEGKAVAGLSRPLAAVADRALKMKDENDLNTVKDAYVSAGDKSRALLHGENGIYSRQGKDSDGSVILADEGLAKISSEAKEALTPKQQKMFDGLWRRSRSSNLDGVARYEAQQRRVASAEATQAMKDNSVDEALLNFNDPQIINESIDNGILAIRTANVGMGVDAMNKEIDQFKSGIHAGVIERKLAAGDPDGAQEYWKANKKELFGKQRSTVAAAVEAGVLRGSAQKQTDKIMLEAEGSQDQLKSARAIKNPALRDETVRRVKVRQAEESGILKAQKEQYISTTWRLLDDGIDNGMSGSDLQKLVDKFPDHEDRVAADAWLGKTLAGEYIYTDQKTWLTLFQASNSTDAKTLQNFKDLDLNKFRGLLSSSDFQEVAKWQEESGTTASQMRSTINEVGKRSLAAMGIDPTPTEGSTDAEQVSAFYRKVWEAANAQDASTREEIDQIMDDLLIEGFDPESGLTFFGIDTGLFRDEQRAFEAEGDAGFTLHINDVRDETVANITQADIDEISAALRRNNRSVNPQNIRTLYTITASK